MPRPIKRAGKVKPLSREMETCLAYIRASGGTIHRYLGGYWAKPDGWNVNQTYFSTGTIQALIERGLLVWTKASRDGSYWIEAGLNDQQQPASNTQPASTEEVSSV